MISYIKMENKIQRYELLLILILIIESLLLYFFRGVMVQAFSILGIFLLPIYIILLIEVKTLHIAIEEKNGKHN